MVEIWKDIKDYPGYQVSSLGNVRTYNKITYTKKHGIRHWKDRFLKQKKSKNKYGREDYRVELWNKNGHKTFLVARLVAFTFFEEDINNSKLTVNHINRNSLDNNINNLELVDLKDNIQHGFKTGLYKKIMRKVKIIDSRTGLIMYCSSLSEGSRKIGYNSGYLSSKIKANIFKNNNYVWEVL